EMEHAHRQRLVRLKLEVRAIHPAFAVHPLAAELEATRERIRDHARGDEIGVHVSGHARRQPLELAEAEPRFRRKPARRGEVPAVVKQWPAEHGATVARGRAPGERTHSVRWPDQGAVGRDEATGCVAALFAESGMLSSWRMTSSVASSVSSKPSSARWRSSST